MKLEVRVLYENGKRLMLALTGEQGEVLPGQKAALLECVPGEMPLLHVSFQIDGDEVRAAFNKQATQPLQQQKPKPTPPPKPEAVEVERRASLPWWRR